MEMMKKFFLYDVADPIKIQELLDWLKKSDNFLVYIAFFNDACNVFIPGKCFNLMPLTGNLNHICYLRKL